MNRELLQNYAGRVKQAMEVEHDPATARGFLLSIAMELGGDLQLAGRLAPAELSLYLLVLLLALPAGQAGGASP
ncbi:hypothetical protein [Aquabacterium sp.]|uniref:hypothetical protein n=1 Tax=Aquabacterium sp. TaxID=1872578 RepID=UPI0037847040